MTRNEDAIEPSEQEILVKPLSEGDRSDSPREKRRRIRRKRSERRREIAAATLSLVARVGLQNTTVSLIADEVGMQAPSLYTHYASRDEMLVAASDLLHERAAQHLKVSSNPDFLVRLREIAEAHGSFMAGEFEGFVIPVFEFMTAPRDSGLSELSGRKTLELVRAIADLVEEGKRQGTIRQDVDARLTAWVLMICYWGEDITQLLGIKEYLADGYSTRIMDSLFREIAPTDSEPPESPQT